MNSPVVLVTGASRGIGEHTALLAAQRGYRVVINYLKNRTRAEELARRIADAGGASLPLQANVANEQEVVDMFARIDEAFGRLDGLVNNAAIVAPKTRLESIDGERLSRIFSTNVYGSFYCAREAVRRMSTRLGGRGGSIVNLSSGAARSGSANDYIDYAASKGAIESMTLGLAREVADEGIRVNAVRPGFIYTEMHADYGEADRVDRLAHSVPMQRGGRPQEVAEAIVWLLSDAASYTTGTFLDVTGGR